MGVLWRGPGPSEPALGAGQTLPASCVRAGDRLSGCLVELDEVGACHLSAFWGPWEPVSSCSPR